MATTVTMPKLGLTMTEGTVTEWKKNEGEPVKKGEVIFVVATDKLNYEVEAEADGILAKVLVSSGDSVPVSDPVCIIAAEGEDVEVPASEDKKPSEEKTAEKPEEAPKPSREDMRKEEPAPGKTSLPSGGKTLLVIGAGPGGYVAAIKAAQLGADVTIVDRKYFGGTCLNVGCIPTKVLLHTVELFNEVKEGAAIGLRADNVSVDWGALMTRKEQVSQQLVEGVKTLLAANGVKMITGEATFVSDNRVRIAGPEGEQELSFDSAIIATGSEPVIPPVPGIESPGVVTSNEALSLDSVPESMTVIGGGVIGVEFASIYASLGTRVTIVEMLPDLLPNTDREVVEVLKKTLQIKGVEIYTSSKVTRFRDEAGKVVSEVETDGGKVEVVSEKVLVSVGRKPVTANLGLENTGVKLNRGRISVDRYMKTTGKNIYAIGDCCSPIMLAHVASREGEVAAENILGHSHKMDYKTAPGCVYTTPEIAWVGMTEEQAAEKGYKVKTGKFPLMANGKCLIMNDTAGFIKFVVDAKHDEVLGVHIIGPRATDLIVEGALALRLEATIDEIVTTIHAHPTVGEALGEAALDVNGAAIHMPPKQ
jgi:dihydrolipoamide dehydrogenase